jgi:hypothetical protein
MEITAYDKERKSGAKVGVGWTQDDGSIALVLNPGTALIYHPNLVYKVKPRVMAADTSNGVPLASEPFKPQKVEWKRPVPVGRRIRDPDNFDDDIPF